MILGLFVAAKDPKRPGLAQFLQFRGPLLGPNFFCWNIGQLGVLSASTQGPDWTSCGKSKAGDFLAKHEDGNFSTIYGFMKEPIVAPGPYGNQEC